MKRLVSMKRILKILCFLFLFTALFVFNILWPGQLHCQEHSLEKKNSESIRNQLKSVIISQMDTDNIKINNDAIIYLTLIQDSALLQYFANDYEYIQRIYDETISEETGKPPEIISDDEDLWRNFGSRLSTSEELFDSAGIAREKDFVVYISATVKYNGKKEASGCIISNYSVQTGCYLLKNIPQEHRLFKIPGKYYHAKAEYKVKDCTPSKYKLITSTIGDLKSKSYNFHPVDIDCQSEQVQNLVYSSNKEAPGVYCPQTEEVWIYGLDRLLLLNEMYDLNAKVFIVAEK